jgi:dTDP-4-amino-4,6-dideoxygalactose transaminase
MIPFNKPYLSGSETEYIRQAVESGKISGDGVFTKKCHEFFESRYGFPKCLLTTSCTAALEMAAILLDIKPGDEVIMPSYTFVSTANAFVLRGARVIFVDSQPDHPNIDAEQIEERITERTKAIVVVHYAGVGCDMAPIMDIAERHGLFLVEDAAQAIESFYHGRPLGSIGHLSAFSFHETKNIISGEGGMLVINDERFTERAEIIREKGTDRSKFFRGEIDKYGWVDIGSSYLPSEIIAAFLYAQLETIERIQGRRKAIWQLYFDRLKQLGDSILLPRIPDHTTNNGHMFYLVTNDIGERDALIEALRAAEIHAVFHYQSLHNSTFYLDKHGSRKLPNAECFSDRLVRLPLFYELTDAQVNEIAEQVVAFYLN